MPSGLAVHIREMGRARSRQWAVLDQSWTCVYPSVSRALFDGLLGDQDVAFEWFDRVGEWPLPTLVTLNCEPRLATLRADPPFERVRSQLNIGPN